jgi:hypothetical protein
MEHNLDFSGGENSWFDLWHIHTDLEGIGNKSPELRKVYLDKLLATFMELKSKLRHYPHKFQLWISISEENSFEDGVYIHTKNPNGDNFPLKVIPYSDYQSENTTVADFIKQTGLNLITARYESTIYFYLYDVTFGEPLL